MKSLVVGGNGFIGVHLVWRLIENGHPVRIYDRSTNKFRPVPKEAEYVEGDLGDHDLIREATKGMEVVYHLASTTIPKTSNDDPAYDVSSNLVNTIRLLEASVASGVRKVVFASSGGTVYGLSETVPVPEDHPKNPISSYGITKLAAEKYLGLFHYLYGLDYAALRISSSYGPYQNPAGQQGAINVFLGRIFAGQPIVIWGDGNVVRDYLYVSDVVDGLVLAAESETRSKVFNIGGGRGVSLNELVDLMAAVTGERPVVEYRATRSLDVPVSVLDISRARKELGWEPKTSLEEGVARSWAWICSLYGERVEAR